MKKILIGLTIVLLLVSGCSTTKSQVEAQKKEKKSDLFDEVEYVDVNTNYLEDNSQADENNDIDQDIVNYVEQVDFRVDEIIAKKETSKAEENVLKNTFITLTDFIFYDGEIKGKKFSELCDSAKEKIIDIYTKIDSKIESKYPGYKEKIKDTTIKTYHNVIDKAKEVRESLKNKYIEKYGIDAYNDRVEEYEESISNMHDVYDVYEPYIEAGKEKAKEGYNKAKDKVSKWYQEYKESD